MTDAVNAAADLSPGLHKVRSRRRILWLVLLIYLPAMIIAFAQDNAKFWMAMTFCVWLVLLIVAVVINCLVRCPRCGQQFHTHGPSFIPLRRCLHCGLHVSADKRPDEKLPPVPEGKC